MKKKVLYFFPSNPLKKNTGSASRALELLVYFRAKEMEVDYVYSSDRWGGLLDKSEIKNLEESQLVKNVFEIAKKPKRGQFFSYLFRYKLPALFANLASFFNKEGIPNYAGCYTRVLFNNILKQGQYDYIIISYAFWAELIKNKSLLKGARTIIDTHDFLTSQHQTNKNFNRGSAFDDEIRRLDLFDEVWAISPEEQYVFSQFTSSVVKLIPFTVEDNTFFSTLPNKRQFDIIYVAGDNFHNVAAIRWFFEKVYPMLDGDLKILIVGAISNHISSYENVSKIFFAEDLSEHYKNARLAICPMLTGTGVKIKVVEALSFGLPVVCSVRGVDGLLNKTRNGCSVSYSEIEFAQNITALLENEILYEKSCKEAQEYIQAAHLRTETYKVLNSSFKNN